MTVRNIIVHPRLRTARRSLMSLIPQNMEIPVLSGALRGSRWVTGAGYPGYWLGTFEKEKQTFFADVIKPNSVVYDIGAHVGFYTLLAAKQIGPEGKVYAFEPAPQNIYYLKRHIELNYLSNVRLLEMAVADKDGITKFDSRTSSYSGQIAEKGNIEVPLTTIDSLLESSEIELPNLIKIDVEGTESKVLEGAQKLLQASKPDLLIAIHGSDQLTLCEQKLDSLGYRITSLGDIEPGIHFDILAELYATYRE